MRYKVRHPKINIEHSTHNNIEAIEMDEKRNVFFFLYYYGEKKKWKHSLHERKNHWKFISRMLEIKYLVLSCIYGFIIVELTFWMDISMTWQGYMYTYIQAGKWQILYFLFAMNLNENTFVYDVFCFSNIIDFYGKITLCMYTRVNYLLVAVKCIKCAACKKDFLKRKKMK